MTETPRRHGCDPVTAGAALADTPVLPAPNHEVPRFGAVLKLTHLIPRVCVLELCTGKITICLTQDEAAALGFRLLSLSKLVPGLPPMPEPWADDDAVDTRL